MKDNLIETNAGNETPTNKLSEILLQNLYFKKEYQNATKAAIDLQCWGKAFKLLTIASGSSIFIMSVLLVIDIVRVTRLADDVINNSSVSNRDLCLMNETANEEYCEVTKAGDSIVTAIASCLIIFFIFWSLSACFFSEVSTETAEKNLEKLKNDTTPGCYKKMLQIHSVSRAKDPEYHLESEKLLTIMEQNEQNPISTISTQAYTGVQKISSNIKNHF